MDDDERRSLMLPPGPARRTLQHFTASYNGDALAPVQELLNRTRSSVRKATDIIASTQDEYDLLCMLDFIEDSPAEKRFFYLRWQNFALRQFIADQREAEAKLWGEMDNVFTDEEESATEPEGSVATD